MKQLREPTPHVANSSNCSVIPRNSRQPKRPHFEDRNSLKPFDENTDLRDPDKDVHKMMLADLKRSHRILSWEAYFKACGPPELK